MSEPNTKVYHPRIAVIGAAGRLGFALRKALSRSPYAEFFDRQALDLSSSDAIQDLCRKSTWDIVILTAAMTNVDACEDQQELAWQINALAPATIAAHVSPTTRVVFISTDFVFSGDTYSPYFEDDVALPCNAYGRGKLAGENAVIEAARHNLVVRSSWLFGGQRPSFPDIMIERACKLKQMDIINDRWSSPTNVDDLAQAILTLSVSSATHGIYHYCNQGICSPYEYGSWAIQCAREAGLPVCVEGITPVSTSESGALKAARPTHSVMNTNRFANAVGQQPRPWQDSLKEYVHTLARHPLATSTTLASWMVSCLIHPHIVLF